VPVVPQEKARLAASLFGDGDSAEHARVRRSPNKQVRSRDNFIWELHILEALLDVCGTPTIFDVCTMALGRQMTWYEDENEDKTQVYAQANRSPTRAAAAPSLLEFDDSQAVHSHPAASAAPASMQGEPSNPKAEHACTDALRNLSQANLCLYHTDLSFANSAPMCLPTGLRECVRGSLSLFVSKNDTSCSV
jgi:hypothetical protein